MISAFKKVGIVVGYIILGYLLECFCEIIHSDYLEKIYRTPYFAVLITMTVFSFTLFSYISGKVVALEEKVKSKFSVTRREIKYAFIELVVCDLLSLFFLVLYFSDITDEKLGRIVIMSALNTLFILVIHILIDLGKSIFKMFGYEGQINEMLRFKPEQK